MTKSMSYARAGVNIANADRLVDHLRSINPAIGGFSGMVPVPSRGMAKPMLVASTDGVGTKLLVAIAADKLETIGIDLVAMSVNDLVVCGALPLLFLDYYATGQLDVARAKKVLTGIVEGCKQAGCPLAGGETAEMPGMYAHRHFDLAGFAVGLIDAKRIIDGRRIAPGDVVLGVASSGLHSNGYSLARKALLPGDEARVPAALKEKLTDLPGKPTLGDLLLEPTRIYCSLVAALLRAQCSIKGMAHITGGGLPGNLNRILPKTTDAQLQRGSWAEPPIFSLIAKRGKVKPAEMLKTFNMGIGLTIVCSPREAAKIERVAREAGEHISRIGLITEGTQKVRIA